MKETTDEHILALVGNSSTLERGFRLLMSTYQERVYWHVRRMVVTHEDADDVVQNTFIKAYRGIDRFHGNSKLYTWLYRIATNEAINFLNKRKRQSAQPLDGKSGNVGMFLKADPYFSGDDATRQLTAAIQTLPEKQRAVFNMRYYDEIPYAEMSEITGTSVGALKASYHHAVKKIESALREGS